MKETSIGLSNKDKLSTAEKAKVVGIRGIQHSDLRFVAKWAADPETHSHLRFLPEVSESLNDEGKLEAYVEELEVYYRNKDEDPKKITPLVAVNAMGEPISVLTLRWRGDPYVPKDRKISSIETVVVDPELRHRGIGKETLSAALEIAFCRYKGYGGGEAAKEVRVWVFTDPMAGEYTKNIHFFRMFGFKNIDGGNWREYAAKRQIENVQNRDAMWFKLAKEKWTEVKKEQPELAKHAPIDFVSIRI